mgnify:FL=1
MDLLKALCLYVYEEYPPEQRTFAEAYKLLLNKSVDMLDSIFERLPTNHPAKGPYQLFAKAEKVKGNAVLGLGTRLQICKINWYNKSPVIRISIFHFQEKKSVHIFVSHPIRILRLICWQLFSPHF